jgi:hypothetical protein
VKGLGPDPLLEDIRRSVKAGYFDDYQPSELMLTPIDELLERVSMMSAARRRSYLASISNLPETGGRLSPPRKAGEGGGRRWLSRNV